MKCNTNKTGKYFRILLSLLVIGMGIYYRNWVGALGLFTLYTAVTGNCSGGGLFFRKYKEEPVEVQDNQEPGKS